MAALGEITLTLSRSDAERLLWLAAREGMIRKCLHHTPWTRYWADLSKNLRHQILKPGDGPYGLDSLVDRIDPNSVDRLENLSMVANHHYPSKAAG
jgi:hypothetical protein